ncbi:class I SAM-dependent methyltransferase [Rhabdothermincola salaria]|uniref:class I SAM-dependent methyltransferase n=1 Tax=Rhabdothermincola salaria TaxID=2903142 RepID=UPI003D29A6FC
MDKCTLLPQRCPVCSSLSDRHLSGYAHPELAKCHRCGHVWHWMSPGGFHEELYSYYEQRRLLPADQLFPERNHRRLTGLLEVLAPQGEPPRMLDVGCGIGGSVRVALALGWDATGIDLAPAAVDIAAAHSLPCFRLDLNDTRLDARGPFDLITLFEVVEHVSDPVAFLGRTADLLSAGGIVHLTTPNWRSVSRLTLRHRWRAIDPQHLQYFSAPSIRLAGERAGLEVLHLSTENLAIGSLVSGVRARLTGRDPDPSAGRVHDQQWRARTDERALISGLTKTANVLLRSTGLGDTLKVTLRKRPTVS